LDQGIEARRVRTSAPKIRWLDLQSSEEPFFLGRIPSRSFLSPMKKTIMPMKIGESRKATPIKIPVRILIHIKQES
jgi:hypothetical protein